MLIEYYATEQEDDVLEQRLKNFHIDCAFNPEEGYYVMETRDLRVLTLMSLMGIEMYVTDTEQGWLKHAYSETE